MTKLFFKDITRTSLLMVFMIFCLSSCEKELDFKIENFQSRINVIAEFSPENEWSVLVTPTSAINNFDSEKYIDDAVVKIKDLDLDVEFTLDHIGEGYYSAGIRKPRVGHDYEITVDAVGYTSVHSFAYVPSNIDIVLKKKQEVSAVTGDLVHVWNIEILDNIIEENYYIVEFEKQESQVDDPIGNPENDPTFIGEDEEVYDVPTDRRSVIDDIYIDESDFDGNKYSLEINSEALDDSNDNDEETASESVSVYLIKIKAVSKDLFLFRKTLEAKASTNELNSNVEVHYNIVNGTGIFGAYSEAVREIKF